MMQYTSHQDSLLREINRSKFWFIAVLILTVFSTLTISLHIHEIYFPKASIPPLIASISRNKLILKECLLLAVVAIITAALLIRNQLNLLLRAKLNMPMVPSSIPFFGTAFQFMRNSPWDLMEAWHRKYGPIYSFSLLGRTCVAIEDPSFLREVLQSKIQNVKKDVHFSYKPFLPILGRGIVTSEGQSWMKQRLKISNTLKVDVLDIIPRITLDAVDRLMVKLDHCAKTGETLDIGEELRHLTLQVISGTFLSLDPEESDATFAVMYLPIVEEGNKRVWSPERSYMIFSPSYWKYVFGVKRLNKYVSSLITKRWILRREEKRCNSNPPSTRPMDVLDKVLAHYENENPDVECLPLNDVEQLRDEFKTFMLAGHETSAAMMMWALFELMKDDALMNKIVQESKDVFGSDYHITDRDILSKLVFSEACLKEALRKYSVVPTVLRRIVSPTKIGNHTLTPECSVIISIQSVHHNDKFWTNPMVFDPTRFLDSNKIPEPYTFLPFIDGPRNCLGQYLALLESKMVISLIAERYKLTIIGNEYHDGSDPRHRFMVPIITKGSLNVSVSKR